MGILAFVAQDASTHVFCYGNADVRKEDQDDEILNFALFWKQRTGHFPQELIFDSKLTTYANLDQLNRWGIEFITLRRRSRKMLQEVHKAPLSAWRHITLDGVSRIYKTPRILDSKITIRDYTGPIRQLVITELGHEEPTFLLTNHLTRSAPKLIGRYAQRMVIENNIADGIDFFHMDALSSAVAMKVNTDPTPGNNSATDTDTLLEPIPTLNEWGLIILSLILLGIGYIAIRRRQYAGS
jgi:hypothetical protein